MPIKYKRRPDSVVKITWNKFANKGHQKGILSYWKG